MGKEKHRGKGEGSIYQRADGRYAAAINLGNGKRKYLYAATRADVAEKLNDELKKLKDGTLSVATERTTVEQYLESWLERNVKRSVRPATYTSYEQAIRLHIIPAIGKWKLKKLSPDHVQDMLNHLLDKGYSATSVGLIVMILRRALNQAIKRRLISVNVASMVDLPRAPRQEVQPLSPEQARLFLDAIRDDRLYALFAVALSLGLRRGEILGLRWQDVDLETGRLSVRVALHRSHGQYTLDAPKTEKSKRILRLPGMTIVALREHRAKQLQEKLASYGAWENEWDLVFTDPLGKPLCHTHVIRQFDRGLKATGLPHFRFHDMRHSAASFLLATGTPLRDIMEILGHSAIATTANLYTHVSEQTMQDAADKMDRILRV